jgi:hypothetical protein
MVVTLAEGTRKAAGIIFLKGEKRAKDSLRHRTSSARTRKSAQYPAMNRRP